MRRARRQVQQAPGRQRARRESGTLETTIGQLLRRSAGHGSTERDGAPPLELKPERRDVPVVMQAEAFVSPAVDEKQKRALLASPPMKAARSPTISRITRGKTWWICGRKTVLPAVRAGWRRAMRAARS